MPGENLEMSRDLENLLGNEPQEGDVLVGPDGREISSAPQVPEGLGDDSEQRTTQRPPVEPDVDLSKFEGKSKEELLSAYVNLQRKLGEQGERLSKAQKVLKLVDPWFNYDPKTEELFVNDAMVDRYNEWRDQQKGPDQASRRKEEKPPMPQDNGDNFDQLFEDNPRAAIDRLVEAKVQERLNRAFDERVTPFENRFLKQQYEGWRERLTQRHSDFPKWESDAYKLAKANNASIRDIEDVAFWYQAAKAKGGGYVDKDEVKRYLTELEKSQSILSAGRGGSRPVSDGKASEEELLGLNRYGKESRIVDTLFGKRTLAP